MPMPCGCQHRNDIISESKFPCYETEDKHMYVSTVQWNVMSSKWSACLAECDWGECVSFYEESNQFCRSVLYLRVKKTTRFWNDCSKKLGGFWLRVLVGQRLIRILQGDSNPKEILRKFNVKRSCLLPPLCMTTEGKGRESTLTSDVTFNGAEFPSLMHLGGKACLDKRNLWDGGELARLNLGYIFFTIWLSSTSFISPFLHEIQHARES